MTTDQDRLWDAIEHMRTGMLTTQAPTGLESRPMSAHVDRDAGAIWFITRIDSEKAHEIADNTDVNVAFGDAHGNSWVSLTGTARVVRDAAKAKELWSPFAEAWMPEGPTAPTTALIEVNPTHGTLWDGPSKLVQLFEIARANVTQTPASGGDVVHVSL